MRPVAPTTSAVYRDDSECDGDVDDNDSDELQLVLQSFCGVRDTRSAEVGCSGRRSNRKRRRANTLMLACLLVVNQC